LPQEILFCLKSTELFRGVNERALKDFAQHCTIQILDVGEHVPVNLNDLHVLLILKGCVAATVTAEYGRFEKFVSTLLMPTQLLFEFEYLGNKFPDHAKLKVIDKTEMISFPTQRLTDLIVTCPQVMRNLAKALVTKINIGNFHLEVVSQTQGDRKLATMLSGFIKIAEWKPADYKDIRHKDPLPLSIAWDIELLTRFLSCDSRTLRDGLLDLLEENLIEVEWLDDSLAVIQGIEINDIKQFGKRDSKIDEKTYFRITIKNPAKLEDYCGD
jgi:hypothetical protein